MMKTDFQLMYHKGWTKSDIEFMRPWERDIYIMLVKEEDEAIAQLNKDR